MASIAAIAEKEGAIKNLFDNPEYNPRGKYSIRLYNLTTLRWEWIDIDDKIPCNSYGTPQFAQPNGKSVWVLLLEKAFAKAFGGYMKLDGNNERIALQMMTGCNAFDINKTDVNRAATAPKAAGGLFFVTGQMQLNAESYENATVWPCVLEASAEEYARQQQQKWVVTKDLDCFYIIRNTLKKGGLVCTGFTKPEHGLITGHAYSVLDTIDVSNTKLVKLRNPWGQGEWAGAWSDNSPLWNELFATFSLSLSLSLSLSFSFSFEFSRKFRILIIRAVGVGLQLQKKEETNSGSSDRPHRAKISLDLGC